jgi:uncharacterized protein YktA (UPF0223 family)
MSFNLRRITDGAGDVGGMSKSIGWNEDRTIKKSSGFIPTVGESVMVGSVTARSYSRQDWWMTTPVTEILEKIKNEEVFYIKFKTGNSIYEWWNGKYPEKVCITCKEKKLYKEFETSSDICISCNYKIKTNKIV